MAETTGISWTDATHNFWEGCHKVSPGCAHCYAETLMQRYGKDFTTPRRVKDFARPRRWERSMRKATYRQPHHGSLLLTFVNSSSDFFLEEADPWRAEAWTIMRSTPHLVYQVLTKRPERIATCLPPDWGQGYPNVWLGVSVENRTWLRRLAVLREVPTVLRWASFEPLLKPVGSLVAYLDILQWAVVGGESGPDRRTMDVAALVDVVTQCQAAGVPIWVKQDTAFKPGQQGRIPDHIWHIKEHPAGVPAPTEGPDRVCDGWAIDGKP